MIAAEDMNLGRKSKKPRSAVIIFCFLVMFYDGYDLNLLGYVGPTLMLHLGIGKPTFGALVSAGLAGFMLGAFVLGDLGDRLGRKRMMVAGTTLFGLMTLGCLGANTSTAFMVVRFLAGVGMGGAVPNAIAFNMELAPAGMRATVVGIMFVGFTLGGAAPGWVVAATLHAYGWQGVFLFGAIPPLVIAAAMALILSESAIFSVAHVRSSTSDSIKVVRRGFLLRQLFTDGRGISTALLWLAFMCCLGSIVFVITWSPTLLAGLGIDPARAALIAAMWQTGGAFGSIAVTLLIDRYGIGVVKIWLALAVPCAISIGQVGVSEFLLVVTMLLGGFFGSGGQVGLNAISGMLYPASIRSTGVGWAFGIGRVGAVLGPIVGGVLISSGLHIGRLFILMSVPFLLVAASVVVLGLRYSHRVDAGTAPAN